MLKTKRSQRNILRILTAATAVFLLLLLAVAPVSAVSIVVTDVQGMENALANQDCDKIIVASDISIISPEITFVVSRKVTITTEADTGHTLTGLRLFNITAAGNLILIGNETGTLTLQGEFFGSTTYPGLTLACIKIEGGTCTLGSGSILKDVMSGHKYMGPGSPTGMESPLDAGAVWVEANGNFVLNGGTITDCQVPAAVYVKSGSFTMNSGTITNIGTRGGSPLYHARINSFFHRGVWLVGSASTFTMNGGTISSCINDGTGLSAGLTKGAGVYVGTDATFTMKGGAIIDNTVNGRTYGDPLYKVLSSFGGGVYVDGGTFTMSGGTISGNKATVPTYGDTDPTVGAEIEFRGAGVYVAANSEFMMSGGTISGNTADTNGAGVYVEENSEFEMTGGTISDNTAKTNGAGVYVEENSEFEMTGGTIFDNEATTNGSGVYVEENSRFKMGGSAQIEKDNDVYLQKSNITVQNGITGGAKNIIVSDPGHGVLVLKNGASYYSNGQFKLGPLMKAYADKFELIQVGNDMVYVSKTIITLDQNGGTGGSPATISATRKYNDAAGGDLEGSITSPMNGNFEFNGWYTTKSTGGMRVINTSGMLEVNVQDYTDAAGKWINTSAVVTLYANWTPGDTTVTLDNDTGSPSGTITLTYGEPVPQIAVLPTKTGYDFEGYWNESGGTGISVFYKTGTIIPDAAGYTSGTKWINDNHAVTLYAKWSSTDCTVTFDPNNGSSTWSVPVPVGQPVSDPGHPVAANPAAIFRGWNNTDGGALWDFSDPVPTNMKLIANWSSSPVSGTTHTVTFDPDNGSGTWTVAVNDGDTVRKPYPDPTKLSLNFYGWNYTNSQTEFDFNTRIGYDISLIANYSNSPVTTHNVTFDPDNGDSSWNISVRHGLTVAQPSETPSKSGYTFTQWTMTGTLYDFDSPVAADLRLVAAYTQQPLAAAYTVTVLGDGHGTCSASCGTTADPGSTVTLTATPHPGYHFTAWRVVSGGVSITGNTFTMPSANVKVIGQFEADGGISDGNMDNAYRILFETFGGSFISPVTGLSAGDVIPEPPAPTKKGYTFGGWYTDESCTKKWSFSDGIPGDMTLYARWIGSTTPTSTLTPTPAATAGQPTVPPSVPVTGEPTGEPDGDTPLSSPSAGTTSSSGDPAVPPTGSSGNSTFYFPLLLLFLLVLCLVVYYLYRRT